MIPTISVSQFFPCELILWDPFEELQNTSPVKSQSDPLLTRRMWPGGDFRTNALRIWRMKDQPPFGAVEG